MVISRYSDQQGSKSRQKVMRLYKQWHRPISKRFTKPPYSISRATSIDSECCRLPTTSVLSKKTENYAPTSFDQQVQVSQGHTLYRNKKNGTQWPKFNIRQHIQKNANRVSCAVCLGFAQVQAQIITSQERNVSLLWMPGGHVALASAV